MTLPSSPDSLAAASVGDRQAAEFPAVAREVLGFLHDRFGFDLWMITRVDQDDWIVLAADDHGYEVAAGDVFRWSDSFCSRMVEDLGPRVAPDSQEVPAYAEAPIAGQVPIKAYVGIPIDSPDGSLFGTLCAIDPNPQPQQIIDEQPLLELLARMLAGLLARDRERDAERRRAERAEFDSLTDPLTVLPNRRAWEEILDLEEGRCQRYGDPATVVIVDLNALKHVNDTTGHGNGDQLLLRAADALRVVSREDDVVARLGGDEFGLLALGCGESGAHELVERVKESFDAAAISAAVGVATRHPSRGLRHAVEEADASMYAAKH